MPALCFELKEFAAKEKLCIINVLNYEFKSQVYLSLEEYWNVNKPLCEYIKDNSVIACNETEVKNKIGYYNKSVLE